MKSTQSKLISIIFLFAILTSTVLAFNEVDFFNGLITIDGNDAAAGTVLEAYVSSTNIKNFTLTTAGEFGIQITNGQGASPGSVVSFHIFDLVSNENPVANLTQVFLSRPINLTFNDTTAPSAPSGASVNEILNASMENSSLNITWNAASDNVWTNIYYNLYRGTNSSVTSSTGTLITTTNDTSYIYSNTGIKPDGSTHYIVAYANDTSGNVGSKSNVASVALTNRIPKGVTNLQTSPSNETLTLAWTAVTQNTDDSACGDLAGYRIYANESGSWNPLGTTTNTSYQNSGLTNGLEYNYKVAAYDTDGNEGANTSTSGTPAPRPVISPNTESGSYVRNNTAFSFTITSVAALDTCRHIIYIDGEQNSTTTNSSCASPYIISPGSLSKDDNTSYVVNIFANNSNSQETDENFSYVFDTTAPTTADNAPAGWQNADFDITLSETDAVSGVGTSYYCIDTSNNCTPITEYTTPVTISTEGDQYFRYYSTDNAGNNQSTAFKNIKLDKTAPTTADDYSAKDGQWQNADQSITLTPACTISGCNWTKYCTDANNTCDPSAGTAYTTPINVSDEGTTYIRYASADNASNTQATASLEVKIDKTAPNTTDDAPTGWQNADFNITLTENDTLSQVQITYYCIDTSNNCTPTTEYATAVTISTEADQYFRYYSADNATNSQSVTSRNIKLDKTAPTTADDYSAKDGQWQNADQSITLTPACTVSGCNWTKYCTDANNTCDPAAGTAYTTPINVSDEGTTYIRYASADNANNTQATASLEVKIDKTAPNTTDDAPTGWQNADFNITLTENDTLSQVQITYYCIDTSNNCTPTTEYATAVTISTEADQYFRYYSADNATNSQSVTSRNIKLDKTAPTTADDYSAKDGQWQNADQSITLTPACTVSGCNWTKFCTDANNTCDPAAGTAYTTPINVSDEGTTYIRYASADNASNTQATASLEVKIDKTIPTVNLVTLDTGYGNDTTPSFTFNTSDNLATALNCMLDINSTYYALNASTSENSNTIFTSNTTLNDGSYSWNILCTDDAGNSNNASAGRRSFRIDTTAPQLLSNTTDYASYNIGADANIITRWNEQYLNIGNISCSLYVDGALESTINSTGQWCNFTYATTSADYPGTTFRVTAVDSLSKLTSSSNMTRAINLSCGSSITSDLTLQGNLDCSAEPIDGLTINTANITLDCNGNQLIGGGTNTSILINNKNSVTVQNCSIISWANGISITGNNNLITNASIQDCSTAGAIIASGTGNNISENTFTNNTVGVQINSNNNSLTDNQISSSTTAAVQGAGTGTTWSFVQRATLTGNNASINGVLSFDGGVLELIDSYMTVSSIFINQTGNITALTTTNTDIVENTTTEIEFSDADSNISFSLSENVSSTIIVYNETPTASGTTANLNVLKGVQILVDNTTSANLNWALLKINYNSSELSTAGVDEARLKIYYYNEASDVWQLESSQGVDTTNNHIWANITHFSLFGVFESALVTSSGGRGGRTSRIVYNTCEEDLECTEWSACELNSQTRTCTDNNGCFEEKTEKRVCAPPPRKKKAETKEEPAPELQAAEVDTQQAELKQTQEEEPETTQSPEQVPGITGMAAVESEDGGSKISKYVIGVYLVLLCAIIGFAVLLYKKRPGDEEEEKQ